MLHPKYKKRTDYCCCTTTVYCNYCKGQNKPYCKWLLVKETPSDLNTTLYTSMTKNTLETQEQFFAAIRQRVYIVGSVSGYGGMSFAEFPVTHATETSARNECERLAQTSPGKLFTYVQLGGGAMLPSKPELIKL